MKLLEAVKSRFGGHTQEEVAFGAKQPLSKNIENGIRQHMTDLSRADLSKYTVERRHSTYPGARSDVIIYDELGDRVMTGRETDDGRVVVWR